MDLTVSVADREAERVRGKGRACFKSMWGSQFLLHSIAVGVEAQQGWAYPKMGILGTLALLMEVW